MRQLAAVVLLSALALSGFPATGETLTPAPAATQLPPEIQVDRHLLRVERLLAADDPAGALASLNEYLVAAGRAGEFYREGAGAARFRRTEARAGRGGAATGPATRRSGTATGRPLAVLPGSIVALGRYEVTLGEYRAFAAATGAGAGGGCRSLSDGDHSWRNPSFQQTDRHPVTCMSWDDAQAYVSWLSRTARAPYRLPTLEELAGAAEGSQPGCYRARTGREGTCPVGTYGRNDLRLSDLFGNVVEWSSRCVDGDCGRRRLHGGHWASPASFLVPNPSGQTRPRPGRRTAFRQALAGFRVARTLE